MSKRKVIKEGQRVALANREGTERFTVLEMRNGNWERIYISDAEAEKIFNANANKSADESADADN